MILQRIVAEDMRRHGLALLLHALAFAGATFLIGMLFALTMAVIQRDAPGVISGDQLRWLTITSARTSELSAVTRQAEVVDQIPGVDAHVMVVSTPDITLRYGEDIEFIALPRALRERTQITWPFAPNATGAMGVTSSPRLLESARSETDPLRSVRLAPLDTRFNGIAGLGKDAVWIELEQLDAFRLPAVKSPDWLPIIIVDRGSLTWEEVDAQIGALRTSRSDVFPAPPVWTYLSGRPTDAMSRALRGLVLILLVAATATTLVFVNLAVYFKGRQPKFSQLITTLRSLGLQRKTATVLAAVEPSMVVLLGTALSQPLLSAFFADEGMRSHVTYGASAGLFALLVAGTGAALSAYKRVKATDDSLRPGASGFGRVHGRSGAWLMLVFGTAAIPVSALAIQSALLWHRSHSQAIDTFPEDLWVAHWDAHSEIPGDRFAALAAEVERLVPNVAVGTEPMALAMQPVPRSRGTALSAGIETPVAINSVSDRWFELTRKPPPVQKEGIVLESAVPIDQLAPGQSVVLRDAERAIGAGTITERRNATGHATPLLTIHRDTLKMPMRVGVLLLRDSSGPPSAAAMKAGSVLGARVSKLEPLQRAAARPIRHYAELANAMQWTSSGVLAFLVIGLFSVQRLFILSKRTELSIRFALGTSRKAIMWLMFQWVMKQATFGILIGAAAAWATTLVLAQARPLASEYALVATLSAGGIYVLAIIAAAAASAAVARGQQHHITLRAA